MAKDDEDLQTTEGAEPAEPDAAQSLTIAVGPDADDDDDDGGGEPAAAQGARSDGNNRGRRQNFRQLRDQTRAAAETIQRMEREIAELRGRASVQPTVVQQQAARPDPVESELENIEAQKQATLVALRASTDEAKADQLTKQWNKLDRQRIRLETQSAARDAVAAAEARRPRVDPQMEAERGTLRATFPKIFADEDLKAAADAEANLIAKRKRAPMSLEIAQEAAATIYARYQLGNVRPPAPTDADRAKHTATSTRPGAMSARVTFTPNKQHVKLAMAYTQHREGLTDQQRVKAYYDEVLKPAGLG